jgi:dynein assembly factor 5
MDTLVLIEHLLALPDLRASLAPLAEQLLKRVLLVAIQWKVGKPQIKIRKAGVINMIALIERQIIAEEQLLDSFRDLVPHLKSCLSDDWAPELRLASCELLEKYLVATSERIGDDELKELYPMLLERLDDSQDPIRLKVTAAINVFFSCRYSFPHAGT